MEKQTFIIPNISCGHCVMSIKGELNEIDGVKSVEGDPDSKSITVERAGGQTDSVQRSKKCHRP